jgi:L-iditol 2-dehydrogenase
MKAIIQTDVRELEVRDVPEPTIDDDDEALVKVSYAGLCGSDVHAYCQNGYEWVTVPRIMGHEYTGTVVEVGAGVDTVTVGDRVVEKPVQTCGACHYCRAGAENLCEEKRLTGFHTDGCFAEYTTVRGDALHRMPDDVSPEHAALTEPVAVAARGVYDRSSIEPTDTVVVQGPGPIGVFTAAILNDMGVDVVVSGLGRDTEFRLPLVERMGIDTLDVETSDVPAALSDTWGRATADAVVDTTGSHVAVESAVEYVAAGGELLELGLPSAPCELSLSPLVRNEVDVVTSYSATWPNFDQATRLMSREALDIDAVVDHYDTRDVHDAVEDALAGATCKPVFSF